MSLNWRDLSFGVEIEYTGMTRENSANVLKRYFGNQYISLQDGYDTFVIVDTNRRKWKIVKDGSIATQTSREGLPLSYLEQYSCELVTPILYFNDITTLQDIVRLIRKKGGKVNETCGIHVHVGAEQFDAKHLRFLCNMIYSKQDILYKSIAIVEDRKRYCDLLSNKFIAKLNIKKPKTMNEFANIWYETSTGSRNAKYNSSRYKILNLHNLLSGRQNTVEYRFFNSTLHAGKVKAYTLLSLMITAKALNQSRANSYSKATSNDKYYMRTWLLQLGMIGVEYKTARYHLIKLLSGDCAWPKKCKDDEELEMLF